MANVLTKLSGYILTPQGFLLGDISASNGRILNISGTPVDDAAVRDAAHTNHQPIILPGFIDCHVHGAGGYDIMDGADACMKIARMHKRHGTTAMLATTMTAPMADLLTAFEGLQQYANQNNKVSANDDSDSESDQGVAVGSAILGVHLEGPYINAEKLGAQPKFSRPFSITELNQLQQLMPIRLLTLAPEVAGNLAAIADLTRAGFKVQLGHSTASFEQTVEALANGATGFTHLFNAMSGLHHREPGMVGAALAHGTYAEIIPDLLHVHPGAIQVAMRCLPKLFCVTDSTSAAGMPDGDYRLGRQVVHKCLGGVRLADGTLAGSCLTMDQAFTNLVDALGLTLQQASRYVSTHAAQYLGLSDRGQIIKGYFADIVVMDADLRIRDVYVQGQS